MTTVSSIGSALGNKRPDTASRVLTDALVNANKGFKGVCKITGIVDGTNVICRSGNGVKAVVVDEGFVSERNIGRTFTYIGVLGGIELNSVAYMDSWIARNYDFVRRTDDVEIYQNVITVLIDARTGV